MKNIGASAELLWSDIKNVKKAVMFIIAFFLLLYLAFGSICPVVCLTGLPCPACGLTRAGISLLTFHFRAAWEMQPFIYPVVLWVAAAFVHRYIFFRQRMSALLKYTGIFLVCVMVLYYSACMYRYFPDRSPYIYHSDNLFQMIVIDR